MPKIIAFAGSVRLGSYNKRVLRAAAVGALKACAEVSVIELEDYGLPILYEGYEECFGFPDNAIRIKQLFQDHQGFLIATPEYTGSIPALLKNVIDWATRPLTENEPKMACYAGKVAAILSASPSHLGGVRALHHLQDILTSLGVLVLPHQVSVPHAHRVINKDGQFCDPERAYHVENVGRILATTLRRLQRQSPPISVPDWA